MMQHIELCMLLWPPDDIRKQIILQSKYEVHLDQKHMAYVD